MRVLPDQGADNAAAGADASDVGRDCVVRLCNRVGRLGRRLGHGAADRARVPGPAVRPARPDQRRRGGDGDRAAERL